MPAVALSVTTVVRLPAAALEGIAAIVASHPPGAFVPLAVLFTLPALFVWVRLAPVASFKFRLFAVTFTAGPTKRSPALIENVGVCPDQF
jgi:hypothetical protein